jgi:16S rRNA pseudouridine516 synthase
MPVNFIDSKSAIMRLDKYLAAVTDLSRSEAKKVIRSASVTVDGHTVTDPQLAVATSAVVTLNGVLQRQAGQRYFMLHKPAGYISATKDRQHLTVLDLLDEDNRSQLHIAGRLDIDTTGLLLITDDGSWSHRVTSPNSHCKKTYWLETAEPISPEAIRQIEQGILLDNEKRPTLPATMELIDEYRARLTISEGKYHQVKRMLAAVGNKVETLHRQRIGDIVLDNHLQPGEYRPLTAAEINSV